ncbi:MAG: M20/M25/M40 family metallo-hydrolase [Candidatus Latescibacteria bacterium]|nr:M20/M25/M40 family metallo-hydrolase [Candidatus Latescibacterota bacterium]
MSMDLSASLVEKIKASVDRQRLLDTAVALVEVPSPTRSAGAVADRLAGLLQQDGFSVERPVADWPEAPAVAVRFKAGAPGRTLQFDGHLDTVHLPFVPPRVSEGILYGSGASDMKGGIAACVEALRVLRETSALPAGGLLLTAHDHHEGPWGDRRQLYALIDAGYVGDAVLLPEYLADRLPLAGRGMAIFEVTLRREGEPAHEVLRPYEEPNVLDTGAELVVRLRDLREQLRATAAPHAGCDAVFVGKIASGEIYNQHPVECRVHGTRRWVTPGTVEAVRADFYRRLEDLARASRTVITADFAVQGDAFHIEASDPLVAAFQAAHQAVTGRTLPPGGKPFVDDGNTFASRAGIPALTHGPDAKGAHTLQEWVPVDELIRLAQVYALTAVGYCASPKEGS